jgi:HEAT repeat protein
MFGFAPHPRTLAAALRDARHARKHVRVSAVTDLVRLSRDGEETARAELARLLREDPDEELRVRAAIGLADGDVRSATDSLIESITGDPSALVRQYAVLALGELSDRRDARAHDLLERLRSDDSAPLRFQALLALHQMGSEGASRAILEAMTDPDPEIRRLSYRLAEAQFAGSGLPELARARARAALDAAEPEVRVAAALALGRFGDTSGEAILVALAARKQRASFEDQQGALALVAKLELRAAMAGLERRAFGVFPRDPLAFDARIALARLGHGRARAEILRGLSSFSFRARTLSAEAAGRARLAEARDALVMLSEQPARAEPGIVRRALARIDGKLDDEDVEEEAAAAGYAAGDG